MRQIRRIILLQPDDTKGSRRDSIINKKTFTLGSMGEISQPLGICKIGGALNKYSYKVKLIHQLMQTNEEVIREYEYKDSS